MIKATLLIVEDDPTQRYVLEQLCDSFDFDAHLVSSGDEAIKAIECTVYAAIVMDVQMPNMDGFECTKKIREVEKSLKRHTPIIACTAHASSDDRLACLKAGMDDYISKPFQPEAFRQVLLRWAYQPSRPNMKLLRPYKSGSGNS